MSATAALSELLHPKRGHQIDAEPDGSVTCSCRRFKAHSDMWSAALASRLGHAHIANPAASMVDLLEFCGCDE